MNDSWKKIHSTSFFHKAEIMKDLLQESQINAVIINKKDSSFNNFGNYEIFVNPMDEQEALALINETKSFE